MATMDLSAKPPIVNPCITIIFSETLDNDDFKRARQLFEDNFDNQFGLWGNPIILGRYKFQVYGVDTIYWKTLFMEWTKEHLLIIMPEWNEKILRRIIFNIQKYFDKYAKVFMGDKEYQIDNKMEG